MTIVKPKIDFSAFLRRQEIQKQIEKSIVSGDLTDGSTVELKTLAKHFEVSKSYMSDILYDFVDSGFFSNHNHFEQLIVRYNSSEAANLGQVRQKTEKNTLVAAMRNTSGIDIKLCRKHLGVFENNVGTAKGFCAHLDFFGVVYFGRDYDLRISKTEKNIWKYCKYLCLAWSSPEQLNSYVHGLRLFLDLCERDQSKDAQRAMLEHITETGEYIVKRLTARETKISDQSFMSVPMQPI